MVTEVDPAEAVGQVYNKEDWHNLAGPAVLEARASGQAVSVIFMDVANFKSINDELGHDQGDIEIAAVQTLVAGVASELRTEASSGRRDIVSSPDAGQYTTRVPDDPASVISWSNFDKGQAKEAISVGHVGGDEVAILAYTDAAGAAAIIERLRTAFSKRLEEPANAKLKELNVGLSIGSASLDPSAPDDPDVFSKLLSAADRAMYADKFRQLPDLNPEELANFKEAVQKLKEANIRPRQFLNYLHKYFDQEVKLQA